jgi:rhamnosyltransferase subunit B
MKIIIVAIGSHGDINPFIGIGSVLRQSGHDVSFLSNSYFSESVRSAGLDFISVGTAEDYNKMVDEVDLSNPTKTIKAVMNHLYFPSMQKIYDAVKELAIPGETIILGITMAFGARIVQEKLDIPLITCHLAPVSLPSASSPARMDGVWLPHWMPTFYKAGVWRLIDKMADMFLGPPINQMRAKLGLPPVKRIITEWIHSPDRVIGLFPRWFAEPQSDWPVNTDLTNFIFFDGADKNPMPSELEEFISHGKPPIIFTAGTAVKHAAAFFHESVNVCEQLDTRAVFLSRYKEHIPLDLPGNILHCNYAPFSELLPKSSALVHHGGIGTCAQALKAGVPQLLTPFGMDQHDNSSRLGTLGVGDEVCMKKYKSSLVADKLRKLLEDREVHARCKKNADALNNIDPVTDVCRIIEAQANKWSLN